MTRAMVVWPCGLLMLTGGILVGCFSTVGGGPAPAPTAQTRTFTFSIGVTNNTGISESEADSILSRATAVLRGKDTGDDVTADVVLKRTGPITSVAGPSVINSKADFDELGHSGKNVIVVEAINFCGAFQPNIVGCAPIGGHYMAVVRQGELEEVMWAHEFGHNRGLSHRSDPNAIMYPQLGYTRLTLNSFEAAVYRGGASGGSGGASPMLGMDGMAATGHGGDNGAPPDSLDEFLGRVYIHGIPYAHAAVFGPEAVPRLRAVLGDSSRKAVWANAAVALSTVGTPEALDSVHGFIKANGNAGPGSAYQAKRAAIMSLGYAVQKAVKQSLPAQRDAALARLHEFAASESGPAGPVQGNGQPVATGTRTAALAGLALSGTAEARQTLAKVAGAVESEPQHAAFARKALGELQKVQTQGIQQYTQKAHAAAE